MDFFSLPFIQQLGLTLLAAGFLLFIVKILRPTSVGKDGLKFEGTKEIPEKKEDTPSILHHRLFKFFEASEVPGALALDGNTDKALLCENFLKFKFHTLSEGFYDFFRECERHDYDGLSKLPGLVNAWVQDYEARATKMVTHTSKGDICGVPKCFNQKFAKWHQRHASQLFDDYENALSDRLYVGNKERAFSMAGSTFYALRETIQDAKYTLENLNGDFDRELDEMIAQSCKED